ncbi:hypothetical protein BpHYR1_040763 [Brachionus plicatilis]|uniref:Uncharacterized protein n=1 Tax=Brachionus plicatilis TaxID=10195 RepID=A0A3M7PS06_BRAPC|nr:hypothetical protein BpHYR1_040763 [Brachionus plicatilis]
MAISFKSTFKDPSNLDELVKFRSMLATMLLIESNGFSDFLLALVLLALDITVLLLSTTTLDGSLFRRELVKLFVLPVVCVLTQTLSIRLTIFTSD